MRERVHVNDLTTLFICPSRDWKTLERKAIADCVYLRDSGGNPVLFCVKNSMLDQEAEKHDLPRIYYTGQKLKRLFDLRYVRDMRKILRENRFDIVHCYNLDFIWGLCFVLLSNRKIPLLLTFNHFLDYTQKSLWQRWLFSRV
ncbi:MAG: glycosyltransferase family 4 protein, partial [Bacteriovoracaceae bacterium]